MKKIFLMEMSAPHWLSVAQLLREQNVDISYWTGWFRIQESVRANFPQAIFHDTYFARIGLGPDGEPLQCGPFDSACEAVWRTEAQTVYDMMNRFDFSHDQSFLERSTMFYEHLVYWRNILKIHSPDLVVFSTPPHVVFDYILLALCREIGIRTLMFEEATVYAPYSLAMRDYKEGAVTISELCKTQHIISAQTSELAIKLRSNYLNAKPYREIVAQEAMKAANESGISGLLARVEAIKARDVAYNGEYDINEKIVNTAAPYKEQGISLRDSFNGRYANSRYMDQVVKERAITDDLRTFYHSNVTPPEQLVSPYIYVPLAGQPERTSNPQADIFCNQILMVNVIAHAPPPGWVVAIREHPNQFHPDFAVNMCRDIQYYKSLLAVPNVRLLSTSLDPFTLIDGAMAVATTGGTSALEASARSKPSMLFGDAWYRDCPGVSRIRNIEDAAYFIQSLLIGRDVDSLDFENYLQSIVHGSFHGIADYPPNNYPMDEKINIQNLSMLVLQRLER